MEARPHGAVSEVTKMRDSKRIVLAVIGSLLVVSGAAAWGGVSAAAPGPRASRPTTRYYTLEAVEVEWAIAPGLVYRAWTYNGTIPGPQIEAIAGGTGGPTPVQGR